MGLLGSLLCACLNGPIPSSGSDDAQSQTDAMVNDAASLTNTHSVTFPGFGDNFFVVQSISGGPTNVDNAITFETWVKVPTLPAVGAYYGLLVKADDNNPLDTSYAFEIRNVAGIATFVARVHGTQAGGGNGTDSVGFDWPDLVGDGWHHVAATYNLAAKTVSERFRFYIDGAPVPSGDINMLSTGEPITTIHENTVDVVIGARTAGGVTRNQLAGSLDEMRLWGIVRSAADIAATYATELTGNDTGLLGYWQFDNNLVDTSGSDNPLHIQGSIDFVNIPAF